MDVIHEEGDFERDTGMDGNLGSQCFSIGMMWSLGLRSFIRRAAVCRTEDKDCSVEEGTPEIILLLSIIEVIT